MYFAISFLSPIEKRSGLPLEQAFSSGMLKCTLLLFESNSTSGITNIKEMLLSVSYSIPHVTSQVGYEKQYTPKIEKGDICLFCLCVWGFSSHLRISHSYGDFTIAGEGLQILTYARIHGH